MRPFLDPNVEQAIDFHEERAEEWPKVMYPKCDCFHLGSCDPHLTLFNSVASFRRGSAEWSCSAWCWNMDRRFRLTNQEFGFPPVCGPGRALDEARK